MLQGSKKLIALGVAALVLALPAQAAAQSPTNDQYDDSSVTFLGSGDPADPGNTHTGTGGSSSGDTLPFSGLDVALIGAVGASLFLLGFGMRRLTRRPSMGPDVA